MRERLALDRQRHDVGLRFRIEPTRLTGDGVQVAENISRTELKHGAFGHVTCNLTAYHDQQMIRTLSRRP